MLFIQHTNHTNSKGKSLKEITIPLLSFLWSRTDTKTPT